MVVGEGGRSSGVLLYWIGSRYVVITKAAYTLTILPDARTVRERFAAGCPCTHCVHCVHCVGFVRYTQTTSGGVRSGRERFAAGWLCSVNARVDASGASGRERRTVCAGKVSYVMN